MRSTRGASADPLDILSTGQPGPFDHWLYLNGRQMQLLASHHVFRVRQSRSQARQRDHKNAVVTSICGLTAGDNHKERRRTHPLGINPAGELAQVSSGLVNLLLPQLDLDRSPTSVGETEDGIRLKPSLVPIVVHPRTDQVPVGLGGGDCPRRSPEQRRRRRPCPRRPVTARRRGGLDCTHVGRRASRPAAVARVVKSAMKATWFSLAIVSWASTQTLVVTLKSSLFSLSSTVATGRPR